MNIAKLMHTSRFINELSILCLNIYCSLNSISSSQTWEFNADWVLNSNYIYSKVSIQVQSQGLRCDIDSVGLHNFVVNVEKDRMCKHVSIEPVNLYRV